MSLLLIFTACGLRPSPAWRIDVWSTALNGYPRLLGIWSPAAVMVFWLVGLPLFALVASLACRRKLRKLSLAIFIVWSLATFALVPVSILLRQRPEYLSNAIHLFYPYQAAHLFPLGNRHFISDGELLQRHRPSWTMRTDFDYGRGGEITWLGHVTEPRESIPGLHLEATRRFNRFGLPAEFGEFDGRGPEPEIAILGDSFAVGYGIPAERIWPAHLLEILHGAGIIGAENPKADPQQLGAVFAVGGFTISEGLGALLRYAPSARPRIVIASFYEGNDIDDVDRILQFQGRAILPVDPYRKATGYFPLSFFETSPFHAILAALFAPTDLRLPSGSRARPWLLYGEDPRADNYREIYPISVEATRTVDLQRIFGPTREPVFIRLNDRAWPLALEPFEFSVSVKGETGWPLDTAGWKILQGTLDKLAELNDREDTRVLLVLAPTKTRVFWPFIPDEELADPFIVGSSWPLLPIEVRRRMKREGSWRPILEDHADRQAELLRQAAQERGLPFLDLAPGLRQRAVESGNLLYFPYDNHWGPGGHRAAAELIAEFLEADLRKEERKNEKKEKVGSWEVLPDSEAE